MLIYLDSNVVQYCADYGEFIFRESDSSLTTEPELERELIALRELVKLEQLGSWEFAAPIHLLAELNAGKPTNEQREIYGVLQKSWADGVWSGDARPTDKKIGEIQQSLAILKLKHASDQRHLAEAIALNASWFLTNDNEVVEKTGSIQRQIRVCRPSQCLQDISIGLFLR